MTSQQLCRRSGKQIQQNSRWRKAVLGNLQNPVSLKTYVNVDKTLNLSSSTKIWTFTFTISWVLEKISKMQHFVFILIRVLWVSWTCDLRSFIIFLQNFWFLFLQLIFFLHCYLCFPSLWRTPVTHRLDWYCHTVFECPVLVLYLLVGVLLVFSFFSFLCLCFNLGNF